MWGPYTLKSAVGPLESVARPPLHNEECSGPLAVLVTHIQILESVARPPLHNEECSGPLAVLVGHIQILESVARPFSRSRVDEDCHFIFLQMNFMYLRLQHIILLFLFKNILSEL